MYVRLCNAPTTFQKMMNESFHDMSDVCIVYINDLMIFTKSEDEKEHNRIVLEVLKRLKENDLYVKPEKCHFKVKEVNFLGMVVSSDGIKMDEPKVKAVLDWPTPTNVQQVRAFLGLGNFYHWFIKDYAILARPLTDLTRKDKAFTFKEKEERVFKALKDVFTKAPIL